MSATRGSAESDWPEKGSPARRKPSSGSEDRLSMLQREDAEEFGEFLHEGKSVAPPIVRSFEEDALLKRPPQDFVLGQEHWLGLHEGIQEKLWQVYRLVNPTSITEAEECTRMVEAISRTRKDLTEKKTREDFESEHVQKRRDLQSRLGEAARRMWDYDRIRQRTEERIAGEALVKSLKRKRRLPAETSERPMINIIGSVGNGDRRRQSRGGNSARHFIRTGCENRSSCPTFPRRHSLSEKTRSWLSPSDRQHLRRSMRRPREQRGQLGWAPRRSVAQHRKLGGRLSHGAYWRSS